MNQTRSNPIQCLIPKWILCVLGASLLLAATTVAHATVRLVDQNLSVASARDGETITFRYRIESDQVRPVWLGAFLVSPTGQTIEDSYPDERSHADLRAGTHWYERKFHINLPPPPSHG